MKKKIAYIFKQLKEAKNYMWGKKGNHTSLHKNSYIWKIIV